MKIPHLATFALASLTTVLAAPALADDHEGKEKMEHHAGEMHHKMKGMHHNMVDANWVEALNLDGDKAEKVRSIQDDYEEDRQELHTEHMQAMRDLKSKREKQLQDVLSEEEMTVLQRMWEAHSMPKGKMSYHHGKAAAE